MDDTDRALTASLLGAPGAAVRHDTHGRFDLPAERRAASKAELAAVLQHAGPVKGIGSGHAGVPLAPAR